MKLTKINLNELANADLNEREMCRLLGGGTPGNCQCSCAGSSTTGTNNSANNASGLTSEPTQPSGTPDSSGTPDPSIPPAANDAIPPIKTPTHTIAILCSN